MTVFAERSSQSTIRFRPAGCGALPDFLTATLMHPLQAAPQAASRQAFDTGVFEQAHCDRHFHGAATDASAIVRKKMDLAGMLGGFITAGLGFIMGTLADSEKAKVFDGHFWLMLLALSLLFVAVLFYVVMMFSYDSLLMPRRFWSETPSGTDCRPRWVVARPPSAAHWVLYQNMLHVWHWQFMPATLSALYGLYLLGVAVVFSALKDFPLLGEVIVFLPLLLALAALFPSALNIQLSTLPTTLNSRSSPTVGVRKVVVCPGRFW
jgi:hypothetical protein